VYLYEKGAKVADYRSAAPFRVYALKKEGMRSDESSVMYGEIIYQNQDVVVLRDTLDEIINRVLYSLEGRIA